MIERGLLLRAFFALLAIASIGAVGYSLLSETEGGEVVSDSEIYGPIFEEPDSYRSELLPDPWVRRIPLRSGGRFGPAISKQIRIDIDGAGSIPSREVTLQTAPAVAMFAGDRRERAESVLRGMQNVLEERGGLVRGISLTQNASGFEAAAIADFVALRLTDGVASPADQALITKVLREISAEVSDHAYAWYRGDLQNIVFGPEISTGLLTYIRSPAKARPATNIFTAYVVRHELEHAVSPEAPDARTLQWVEEGLADTLARWPGAAAHTARELGMPYPKRYDKVEYRTVRGGYPEWTDTLRVLLGAAGVDWRDPKAIDEASELLQSKGAGSVPTLLADRIGERNRLTAPATRRLEAQIRSLNGSPRAARALVAKLRAR